MVSTEVLRHEAAHYRELATELKTEYQTIDDETLADTLEGLSDLPQMIEEIIRSSLDDAALVVGLKSRLDDMSQRLARLKLRYDRKRELASWAMGRAGIGKLQTFDYSASLAQGGQRLEVTNEASLPDVYFVPQPAKLDRSSLSDALKRGEAVEGAHLVQSGPHIVVRTR